MYIGIFFAARHQWSRIKELQKPRTFIFPDKGFTVRGNSFAGQNKWSIVGQAEKLRDVFLLQTNHGASCSSQLQEFIALLKGKVKNCHPGDFSR
jgi:hypothetical protein